MAGRKSSHTETPTEKLVGLAFTKTQFLTLLKMIYIANTVANGRRTELEQLKHYDEIEQYLFSRARIAGFTAATWTHRAGGEVHNHPSELFERDDELTSILDKYDEETFWDELELRLAERDIEERFGADAKKTIPPERYRELVGERSDIYDELFDEFALKFLKVENLPPYEEG